jgi:hypothetical protein
VRDIPSDRNGDERAEETSGKEAPPDPGQSHQLEDDRGQRQGQRGTVGPDQEWQGVQDAANFYPNRALLQAAASGGGWPDAIQPVMIRGHGRGHEDAGPEMPGGQPGSVTKGSGSLPAWASGSNSPPRRAGPPRSAAPSPHPPGEARRP